MRHHIQIDAPGKKRFFTTHTGGREASFNFGKAEAKREGITKNYTMVVVEIDDVDKR